MNELTYQTMLTRAEQIPMAEAVVFGEHRLSYKDLAHGSAKLAHMLGQLNIANEQCIGIFSDKRIEPVIAMYGIMMAGGAYVPLDIKNPAQRIQYIVDQCQIATIITTPSLLDKMTAVLDYRCEKINIIVLAEEHWQAPESEYHYQALNPFASPCDQPVDFQQTKQAAASLAAVLYTSGSTGVPKGVMITHANISHFVCWVERYFKLEENDRCASHAPFHFDLSLLDIFATHHGGATAVLLPDNMSGNPKFITRFIEDQRITLWQSVPSVLVLMLKYGKIADHLYHSLRHVLFAGERISTDNLQSLRKHFNSATFHNIYGATETNDTFIYSIAADSSHCPDPLPIGKPLEYVDYRIETADKTLVGPGEQLDGAAIEGHLLVSAPTLMRGYKNGRTDGCIYLNRLNPNVSERYYQTNDIVNLLSDGNLVFAGRTDDIVKTMGFRVNLLEIENTLQSHENLSDVAVIPEPDDEAGNKIIAIVTAPSNPVTAMELKIFCAKRLAKYAIPHLFEISSTPLPKTSSGKINKKLISQTRSYHVSTS